MNPILLDTHAAMWSINGSLKGRVAKIIDDAARRGELILSAISAWEIGMLAKRERIELPIRLEDYVRTMFGAAGVVTAPVSPVVALAAATLPGTLHGDPADRILIATASSFGATLVTRDRAIIAYAEATRYVRCLPC